MRDNEENRKVAYFYALSSRLLNCSTYQVKMAAQKLNIQIEKVGNIEVYSPRDHERISRHLEKKWAAQEK